MFTVEGSTAGQDDDRDADPVTGTTIAGATVTVTDDDDVAMVAVTLDPTSVTENGGEATVTVALEVTFADAATLTVNTESVEVSGGALGSFTGLPATVTLAN